MAKARKEKAEKKIADETLKEAIEKTDEVLKESVEALKEVDKKEDEQSNSRVLRKRKLVVYDDEAKEADDEEEAEEEEEQVEKPRKVKMSKEENKLLDILKEYSINKLLQLREQDDFDLSNVHILCPFKMRSKRVSAVIASQDFNDYGMMDF